LEPKIIGSVFIFIDQDESTPYYVYLNESPEATPEFLVYTDPGFPVSATPTLSNSVYFSNYGEILQEETDPSILRFVDTSSKIDIRSFRGAFANSLNGIESITYTLNVYESDSPQGPWLLSTTTSSMSVGTFLLARDAKRYAKFEVVIDTEVKDLSVLDFSLLIEVAIADPNSPVLSRAAKNVLKRFPSWMKIHSDSEDQEDENTYVPKSTGGKLIQSVLSDNLDYFEGQVDIYNINRFVGSADVDQVAWIYSALNVPNTFNRIVGDGIELAKVTDIIDLYDSKQSEYAYFHNPINRQIITLRKYNNLLAISENTRSIELTQIPIQRFNWFDEFGARVGLNRLYLEDNISYRFRILDVFKNPTSSNSDGFKNAIRRELNLWKAFGATPNEATPSLYYTETATPEIMEIRDIERSSLYFEFDGSPKQKFIDLVRYLNERYPTNWGYFRFNEAVWDTAGLEQDGVDRIKSRYYDELNQFDHYQPGVGDFTDSKLIIRNNDATPNYFSTNLVASGKKKIGTEDYYSPILVEYDYSGTYTQQVYDNNAATVNLTLEGTLVPYGNVSTNTEVFATIIRYVKNQYGPTHSASPEFVSVNVFDTEGYTSEDLVFKNKATPSPLTIRLSNDRTTTKIPYNKLIDVKLKNGIWNGLIYATPNSDNFSAYFSHKNNKLSHNTPEIIAATPSFDETLAVKIVSNVYNTKQITATTKPIRDSFFLNKDVANEKSSYELDLQDIQDSIIYPLGATPNTININVVSPTNAVNAPSLIDDDTILLYGGVSYDPEIDSEVFIPSSPNIISHVYGGSTPGAFGFISSQNAGATVNYHFGKIQYNYPSTPSSIVISSNDSGVYPFTSIIWDPFTIQSSTPITGIVDENGILRYSSKDGEKVPGLNNNIIDLPEITRSTFGLTGSDKFDYFFETISVVDPQNVNVSIWSDQNVVKPFLNRTYVLEESVLRAISNSTAHVFTIDYPIDSISEAYDSTRNTTVFSNIKIRGKLYDYKVDSYISTGWVHIGNKENYIYNTPIENSFTGNLDKITLSSIPHQGAPIILSLTDQNATPITGYREIAFADQATPGNFSFYNSETLYPKANNSFYLGYKNVYDLSVKDLYTGETIVSGSSTSTSVFSLSTTVAKLNQDRQYLVTYKVRNSYYVDTNLIDDEYVTSIVFDSTPASNINYSVIYEGSAYETATPVNIEMNPYYSSIDSGYIAISKNEYDFSHIKIITSPSYVLNDGKDFIDISIFSYDVNNNRKPHQTFDISSTSLILSSNRVTTDKEGYAHITATCPTSVTISSEVKDIVIFNGVDYSSDPTAHINSSSGSYQNLTIIDLIPVFVDIEKVLTASVSSKIIKADGQSEVYINGILTNGNDPVANAVVYWKKANYVYDALTAVPYDTSIVNPGNSSLSGIVFSEDDGRFTIGPFTAQDRDNPGYWFVSVESEFSDIITSSPVAIDGDIVYWLEDYDSINYNYNDSINLIDLINFDQDKSLDLYATPSFVISYYNEDTVEVNSQNPLWQPPKWFTTKKYDQYQSGLLGSTPYYIEDYTVLIRDYEEQ
jgi:hypothetical protein